MAQINLSGSLGLPGNQNLLGNITIQFPSTGTITMSAAQWSNKFIEVTSNVSLSGTVTLIAPLNQGQEYVVQNSTTGGQAVTFVGPTGSGVTIPDGYTIAVICDGINYIQIGGTSVVGGSFTAGGDLSGSNTHQTVTALQGNPLTAGTLNTSNAYERLDWDGYHWTATVPADGEIIGQSTILQQADNPWSTLIDDAPVINAWITQNTVNGGCGKRLKLVNCVLKTPVNWTPLVNASVEVVIYQGLKYQMNSCEFDMPFGMLITGASGGGDGDGFVQGPSASVTGYNSNGSRLAPEPNNQTSDGYVGSAYEYMWIVSPTQGLTSLTAAQVGSVLNVSAVGAGSTAFIGNWIVATVNAGRVRLVFQGGGTLTNTESATGCTWTCPGTAGGSALQFANFGNPIPVLPVYQCQNLTNLSYRHWMSLSNCQNADLNNKIHRIMGIANSTIAYIIGWNLQANHNLILPDYGVGGTNASNSTIKTYEAFPVFRMTNYNTVRGIVADNNMAPVFVMDGTDAPCIWCHVENCSVGSSGAFSAPANVPFINDGCFWFTVRKCFFANYLNNNMPAAIYLTGTNGSIGGAYCGIGRIEDCELEWYGVVSRQESGFLGSETMELTNVVLDVVLPQPGTSWTAVLIFDGGAGYYKLIGCAPADQGGTDAYLVELMAINQAIGAINQFSVSNIVVDNSTTGGATFTTYGPNICASGIDLLSTGTNVSTLTLPATSNTNLTSLKQYSNSFRGYVDNMEIDRNASFSPVMTLPFQLELSPILTVADWNLLPQTGTVTATATGVDGYALWGPDLSSGKMISVNSISAQSYFTLGSWIIANPQVGDVLLAFIRIRSSNPAEPVGNPAQPNGGSFSIYYPEQQAKFNYKQESASCFYPLTPDLTGGQWQNVVSYNVVTSVSSNNWHFSLTCGSTLGYSNIVDPESIAICYIPVSQVNTETIPISEIVRLYRKTEGQITGATSGDVAIPTRSGLSFGSLGARISSDMVDGYLQLQSGPAGAITFDGSIQGSSIGSGVPVSYGIANVVMPSDANVTLSSAQFTQPILRITSSTSLTATRSIVLPMQSGAKYDIYNHTTGSQSLIFIGTTGSGVTVPNGIKASIYFDGTNYVPAGIIVGGDLTATNDIAQTVVAIQGNQVLAQSLTSVDDGYVMTWDGYWYAAPSSAGSFVLAGDVTGAITSNTVVKINGTFVPATPSANQVLVATSGTAATWEQISNVQVSTSAAIAVNKLAAGTSAQVLLNNSTPAPTWTSITGDVALTNAGATTVQAIQNISVITGTPSNNNVLGYNSSANQLQYFPLGSGGGGGTVTASFIQPAVGSTVNVFVNSTAGFSNGAALYLVDPNGVGGFYEVTTIPTTLEFTLMNLGGFGSSSASSGISTGALFVIAGKDVFAQNLEAFGDGYDGVYASGASGTTTLLRDTFYSSMSWQSGSTSQINLNGFRLFCSGRCNLQNAPASAIYFNGVAGGNGAATGAAGSAGVAATVGTMGTGNSGGAGGASSTTTGGNGTVGTLATFSNGGQTGIGGAGGAGTGGAGGTSPSAPTTQSQILFHRIPDVFCAGNVLVSGGSGGSGGGAGGGNGSNAGGGGGGGASGGGFAALNINEVYVDNTTATGAISSLGGVGGNGGTATSVGASGGGAGSGGGGGVIVLTYGVLSGTGSGSTNVLLASGGNGGTGGNGDSAGGAGGHGGNGGLIELVNGGAQMVTDIFGAAGTSGGAASGTTGGSAGAGGLCGTPLAPPNPIITAVYPNFGSAAGGWTFYIAGANLSTVSTVKIGTNLCTSVTYHSSGPFVGLVSGVTPSFGNNNGSSTGQVITVTLSGGSIATSATAQQNYFYLPCNQTILDAHAVAPPFVTIGTGVSNLASLLPSGGKAWAQATGGDQPALQTSFNGTGLNGLTFNGSSDFMATSTGYSASTSSSYFVSQVISPITTFGGNWSLGTGVNTGFGPEYDGSTIGTSGYRSALTGSNQVGTIDTNAHVIWFILTGGAGCSFNQNATNLTGNFSSAAALSSSQAAYLGQYQPTGVLGHCNYAADLIYSGVNSSADSTTIVSILNQIYLAV